MINTEKLKKIMKEKNIPAVKLAAAAGVTRTMMGYIISGEREPSVRVFALMAKKLGCTMDELVIKD